MQEALGFPHVILNARDVNSHFTPPDIVRKVMAIRLFTPDSFRTDFLDSLILIQP